MRNRKQRRKLSIFGLFVGFRAFQYVIRGRMMKQLFCFLFRRTVLWQLATCSSTAWRLKTFAFHFVYYIINHRITNIKQKLYSSLYLLNKIEMLIANVMISIVILLHVCDDNQSEYSSHNIKNDKPKCVN